MTNAQRLADSLNNAKYVSIRDDDSETIWAWFGSERVYEYSTRTGKEVNSFYQNGLQQASIRQITNAIDEYLEMIAEEV